VVQGYSDGDSPLDITWDSRNAFSTSDAPLCRLSRLNRPRFCGHGDVFLRWYKSSRTFSAYVSKPENAMRACMVSPYVVYQCPLTRRYLRGKNRAGNYQYLFSGSVDTFTRPCEPSSVQLVIHNSRRHWESCPWQGAAISRSPLRRLRREEYLLQPTLFGLISDPQYIHRGRTLPENIVNKNGRPLEL